MDGCQGSNFSENLLGSFGIWNKGSLPSVRNGQPFITAQITVCVEKLKHLNTSLRDTSRNLHI